MAITQADLIQELDKHGFELKSYSQKDVDSLEVQASKLHPVSIGNQELYVSVPVALHVKLDKDDHIQPIKGDEADRESIVSAERFVKALADNNQIDGLSGLSIPNATHKIEINDKGQKVVKRRGYSLM